MNYVFVIPVILAVGAFSAYHFYSLTVNTTTIEGWEKDKAAILKRNGKIQEIKFPYESGGTWSLFWVTTHFFGVFPRSRQGLVSSSSCRLELKLMLALSVILDRDVVGWPPRDPALESQKPFKLPDSPWTYENGDFNPALRPSNAHPRPIDERSSARAYTSALPPYHPDFEQEAYPLQPYFVDNDTEREEEYPGAKVRRGSEGYEVRPINREEMLREYIQSEIERTGRYQVYQPEDVVYTENYESDSRDEIMVSDDDRLLGLRN
ncbi:hypothetical protein J3R82DRAFT_501 [Butyriboletus roseoflavus]|nr:hypothetical protein J3R82DRAFT_501 [Butyriboletus roseoflavus]